MIIDIHGHADWCGHDFKKYIANMERYNIDITWILTWESPRDDYGPVVDSRLSPTKNEFGPVPFANCLSYVERAPEKFILGYAPDPRRPDAIDVLDAAIEIHGVQVYGELKVRMMFDNLDALRMYRFCGKKGLPVLIHMDYELPRQDTRMQWDTWWYGGGMDPYERAIQACPETIFIGHGPGFWAHISGDDKYSKEAMPEGPVLPGGRISEMLRKYPNFFCDISAGSGHNALSRDLEFTKDLLIEFQDRIMYGRDYFDNIHQELLNSLGLPETVLEKLYFKNALKLVDHSHIIGKSAG